MQTNIDVLRKSTFKLIDKMLDECNPYKNKVIVETKSIDDQSFSAKITLLINKLLLFK